MKEKEYWIEALAMLPHPEGGFYKETYRSSTTTSINGKERNLCTAIYFLLTSDNFSAFHKIKSDEIWHFYEGSSISILYFTPEKTLKIIYLGKNIERGEQPQAVVPANCWFASYVPEPNSFALVGCTVSYGFDFEDFEMAQREHLLQEFPAFKEVIEKFTR
jgi:predicted cupin superfamily sugar epimerase